MRLHPRAVSVAAVAVALVGCRGNVFELAEGSCFDEPGDGHVTDVAIVDCDEPHDHEVFAVLTLDDGDWPGQAAMDDEATTSCLARFADFVGIAYQDSVLDISWLTPTERGWDEADDREILCSVVRVDREKLEGSAEDSGI